MTNSRENIDALRDIVRTNSDAVAVFVGAGASIPLGIKGWDDLLKSFASTYEVSLDIEKSIKDIGYPGTASQIYEQVGDHDKYLDFMSKQFEPRNCRYTSLHETLIENFKVILTTNYDAAFETYCQKKGLLIELQKLPNFNILTLFSRPTIVYLHGNNDERKYILRAEEYDSYYPSISMKEGSHELESFLDTLVSNAVIVFIGFSFKDTYISKFLAKSISEKIKDRAIHQSVFKKDHPKSNLQHFVIISDEEKEIINEIEQIDSFRIITYQNGFHVEIEKILESVMPTTFGGSLEEEAANAR